MYSFSPRLWVIRVWFFFSCFLVGSVLFRVFFCFGLVLCCFLFQVCLMILLPCFSRRGHFLSYFLFDTSIIPSHKCLPTFRLLTIQNLIQTGIHKDWKSFESVWCTQLLQMHAQSLPGMAQDFSWSQDNGICKVRQCQVHSTGKLLLSTKSALKRSHHDTVPNSGEFSLFAFWGWLGTVPSPGTKQEALKSCSNSHLSAHCSTSLFQQQRLAGLGCALAADLSFSKHLPRPE